MGDGVNMVSAVALAQERGLNVATTTRGQDGAYESYVRLTVVTGDYERAVAGTVFADGKPRFIQVRDINMEFEVAPHMLFVRNSDKPGFIGRFGSLMGEAGVNIATLNLGRDKPGGDAICLVTLDEPIPEGVLTQVKALPQVIRVNRLRF
jgi:D-3-phosphoglycerate dehydrogenase